MMCRPETAPDHAIFELGDGRELRLSYTFEGGIDGPERAHLVIDVLLNGQPISRLIAAASASFTEPQQVSVCVYHDALAVEFGPYHLDGRCWVVYFDGPADVNGYRGSTADRIADWLNPKAGVDLRTRCAHLRTLSPAERERFYAISVTEPGVPFE